MQAEKPKFCGGEIFSTFFTLAYCACGKLPADLKFEGSSFLTQGGEVE